MASTTTSSTFRRSNRRSSISSCSNTRSTTAITTAPPRKFVQEKLDAGRVVILEIDVEGARQVKTTMPDSYAIFIKAPNEEALLARLRGRQREDEETIQKRFSLAKKEIAFAESTEVYDAFVINDDFDRAVAEIQKLVHRRLEAGHEPTLF